MKKYIRPALFILVLIVSGLVSACQEETVQPVHDVKGPSDAASGLA